jgi:hypothetical protein
MDNHVSSRTPNSVLDMDAEDIGDIGDTLNEQILIKVSFL